MFHTTERTRVRMLQGVAGFAMPQYGIQAEFHHPHGAEVDLHPDLAKAWIASGQAEATPATSEARPSKKGK